MAKTPETPHWPSPDWYQGQAFFKKHPLPPSWVFFGSSRIRPDAAVGTEEARLFRDSLVFCRHLARKAASLPPPRQPAFITGGGPGLMEAANRAARETGLRSVGFSIVIRDEQALNPQIDPDHGLTFRSFAARKHWLLHRASLIVVLPGGIGTLDELFEGLTLCKTGKLPLAPKVLAYPGNFWRSLVNWETIVDLNFTAAEDLEGLVFADTPEAANPTLEAVLEKNRAESDSARA
ncbi:MAG: LOG family protein [Opitutales bacterium]